MSRMRKVGYLAILLVPFTCAPANAQGYPTKPVRLLVGFAPGGATDVVGRLLAQKLTELLGQTVVVENRGGANTAIATEAAARAAPDGYTILINAAGHVTNPSLMKLNFDPVRDFAFISLITESQNLLVVHPSFPARTVKELIAFSKARPGQINFASQGAGSSGHLTGELFQFMAGLKWLHVPYKGAGPAMIDLVAGHTSLMFPNAPGALPHVRSGKLRALAVSGARRANAAPEIPTVAESAIAGFDVTNWFGLAAPAKTPRAIIERLHADTVRALKSPDVRDSLIKSGADPVGNTPEQYTAFIQEEIAKWAKVIKAAGIKGQ